MTTTGISKRALAVLFVSALAVSGACGRGRTTATKVTPTTATAPEATPTTAAATVASPTVAADAASTDMSGVDTSLSQLDKDLSNLDSSLSADEGDPTK